ncbi:Voltage-dependent P/Q-type calcium channel subunit alpha-1A, partial [Durusdinium trenchii]
ARWCWNGQKTADDREIFLIHIGKIAGCSLVGDLSKLVGRDNIYTAQVCWDKSTEAKFEKKVLMLRRPKDHLLSIYQQCHQPGPMEIKAMERRGIAPGQPGFTLPSFGDWVRSWNQHPPKKFYHAHGYHNERFHCMDPRNPAGWQLTCTDLGARPVHIDEKKSLAILYSASVVGILEAYHESICLFSAKLRNSLPSHCNCEDASAWDAFVPLHIDHNHTYSKRADDYDESVQKDIEGLTQVDRKLYQAGVTGFIKEMDGLEKTFKVKVLCHHQRQTLLSAASG